LNTERSEVLESYAVDSRQWTVDSRQSAVPNKPAKTDSKLKTLTFYSLLSTLPKYVIDEHFSG